ncbi:MAG: metallophosphoesterase family protein [Acidimicrobiia bacterium]
MARVVALGDAHLGRQYYSRTTPEGVNQREVDFETSFEEAVALGLSLAPDVMVWLGDIFDHPRPGYRAFRVAQRALSRIRGHGVPLVAISGNHDTPRLPGTGSPYTPLADTFGEFRLVHGGAYEAVDVAGLRIHAVPQTLTVPDALSALDQADRNRSLDRVNLLLTHPRVPEVEPRRRDVNELEIDAAALRSDLVLLGHYHVHTPVRSGVWYAGSTDTFSFGDDPHRAKGVVVLETDTGTCTHHPLPGRRPLVTPDPVAAAGLSPAELESALSQRAHAVPAGAVARVFVDGADPDAWHLLDHSRLAEAFGHALWFRLEPTFLDAAQRVSDLPTTETMAERWARFLEHQDLTGYQPERLARLGDEMIRSAIDEAG